jgi:hypothetical protein
MLPLLHPRFVIRRKDATGVPSGQPQSRHAQLHVDLGYVGGTLPDPTLVIHASLPPASEIAWMRAR